MKNLLMAIVAICFATSALAAKPIKALIVTGQNNHNWPVSHVMLKDILEKDNYIVDLAISPKQGEDMSNFKPAFNNYQLVVLDYNGDSWCDETNAEFLKYVQAGKGLVIYHAANNAFKDWDEYEKIIALGGWGGRGDKSPGYYTEWKDDKVVKYEDSAVVGNHGKRHDFTLNCRNSKHPITKNLPKTMVQTDDELYDHMKGKANIKDVLYTAYSDPASGGTGKEEILIFTVDYPKSKIFHTMLGHAGQTVETSPALKSETFVKTFLSGAAWACGK